MIIFKMERVAWKVISPLFVCVIVLLLASSCGDGGLGSFFAGGGISGTGRFSGTISGFGSVFVNGVEIETTGAQISIDDISSIEDDLKVGMKVHIEATDNVASSIRYNSEIKGPIESGSIQASNNSFSVLGQTVIVDATTVYEGLTGFTALVDNSIVEVSGYADADANILATFVELEDAGLLEFQVRGLVSTHNNINKTFNINNITVDYSSILNPPAISDGSTVEVHGSLVSNTLVAVEIEIEDFSYNSGDEVELEGVITSLTSQSDFVVNNQRVQTTLETTYEHGTASNIAANVRVEVKGNVDSNNILIAENVEVRFVESTGFEIEGEVQSVDAGNSTVTVFGITIHVDTNTGLKDEVDGLRQFTLADIQTGDFLEIGGFVDSNGDILAVKLERDKSPGQNEYELSGPVESENFANKTIVILGVIVNLSGAFENINDASEFFSAIDTDDIVEVKGSFSNNAFFAIEVERE